jgi:hypothetical protein
VVSVLESVPVCSVVSLHTVQRSASKLGGQQVDEHLQSCAVGSAFSGQAGCATQCATVGGVTGAGCQCSLRPHSATFGSGVLCSAVQQWLACAGTHSGADLVPVKYVLVAYLLGSLCVHQTQDCMIVMPLQGPCCQSSHG